MPLLCQDSLNITLKEAEHDGCFNLFKGCVSGEDIYFGKKTCGRKTPRINLSDSKGNSKFPTGSDKFAFRKLILTQPMANLLNFWGFHI